MRGRRCMNQPAVCKQAAKTLQRQQQLSLGEEGDGDTVLVYPHRPPAAGLAWAPSRTGASSTPEPCCAVCRASLHYLHSLRGLKYLFMRGPLQQPACLPLHLRACVHIALVDESDGDQGGVMLPVMTVRVLLRTYLALAGVPPCQAVIRELDGTWYGIGTECAPACK